MKFHKHTPWIKIRSISRPLVGAIATLPRSPLLHHHCLLGTLYKWNDTALALVWLLVQPAALMRAVVRAPVCSGTVCSHCSHLYEPLRFIHLHSGDLGPPVLDYSQPTYRTSWHVPSDVSAVCQVESLVARYGLLSFGGCCQLSSSSCSSISVFVCLPFFTPGREKTLEPITL